MSAVDCGGPAGALVLDWWCGSVGCPACRSHRAGGPICPDARVVGACDEEPCGALFDPAAVPALDRVEPGVAVIACPGCGHEQEVPRWA